MDLNHLMSELGVHKGINHLSSVGNKGYPNYHNKCEYKDLNHLMSELGVYKDTNHHLDDKDIHY